MFVFKSHIDKELNEFLLQRIKFAEEEIKKAKKHYISEYLKSMEKIEEKKKTSNPDSFLLKREEEMIRSIFEGGLKFSAKIWLKFIEDCKKDLK